MAIALPQGFKERMQRLLLEDYEAFEATYDRPLVRGIRVNTLKADAAMVQEALPLTLAPIPFCADGFAFADDHKAGADPLHHAGAYYCQEPSAMSAVTALAPKAGEYILDLCAAPGGKSTQIAAALQGEGLLWCNEFVRNRALVLSQNMERCGVKNAVISQMDVAPLCDALGDIFDGVLTDVPCSGEGMFRKEPDALADWSEDAIQACVTRGRYILNAAAKAVAPGGRLLYSTCTFAPEENECQIAWFLQHHPDFTLEPLVLPFGQAGFTWERVASFADTETTEPTVSLTLTRRILPPQGEGHFVALLRRKGETAPHPAYAPPKAKGDTALDEARALYEECLNEPCRGTLTVVGDTVRLLPPAMPAANGLHLIAAGVAVAVRAHNRWEPAHGLFMTRRADECARCVTLSPSDPALVAFLRGEEITVADTLRGYCAVAVGTAVCGFGKASNGRLKNRYPKGLRLLNRG